MPGFTLYIGYRNVSSWSLRGWLMARKSGLKFTERFVRYREPEEKAKLLAISPTGKVPLLVDERGEEPVRIWETIAIGEYLAEHFPDAKLWPLDPAARALARSVSAEMHAGFSALRSQMSMDLLGRSLSASLEDPALKSDVARIETIWTECRTLYGNDGGGPFLFGHFTIADAMFAPVATRFRTYDARLDPICQAYADTILSDPDMLAWEEAARSEG